MKTDWKKTNQPVFLIWNTEVKSKFFWVLVIIISITQGTFISFLWNIDNKNTMWVTYIIEIFLVATLKNKKTSKIASNNIFYSKATSLYRANSLEKTLRLEKIEGKRRRGWQRMDCWMASLGTEWDWASSGRLWMTGKPGMLQFLGSQRVGHDWTTEQQPSRTLLEQISVPYVLCFASLIVKV